MIGWRWAPWFSAALLLAIPAAADDPSHDGPSADDPHPKRSSTTAPPAEPSEGEKKAAAQTLFDEARQLTTAGHYAEACPKYLESNRLDPSMGTKFYMADCFEHIGKLASAWTFYIEAADQARGSGQTDRETYANEHANAIKPRLARLAIKVSSTVRALPGLTITRDGIAVGEPQWGIPIPVDLGPHVITVTATDRRPSEVKIETPREGAVVEVPAPLPELVDTPPPPLVPPLPPPPSPAQRIAGFALGGAGVVSVALGAAFGVQAVDKKNASNAGGHCDSSDTCDSIGLMLRSEGLNAANASTASIVVGALALGGGIVLVATAPGGAPVPPTVPSVVVGPRAVSLAWRW